MSENETTILRTYDDIQRELELIVLLVKLSDRIVSNPVKMLRKRDKPLHISKQFPNI
jgi:hypothetical protein